ncbi:MAG: Lpg1974 family pore-forming outer membrane protein [Pirellulaceae bacterium]
MFLCFLTSATASWFATAVLGQGVQHAYAPQAGPGFVQPASCTDCSAYGCSDGSCGVLGGLGGGMMGGGMMGGPLSGMVGALGNAEMGLPYGNGGPSLYNQNGPMGTGGCCTPRWFDFEASWLYWNREFDDNLAFSSEGILGPEALSASDLDISNTSGFRITGAYLIGPATNIEATYFGGFNWNSSASANSGDNLYSVFSDFGTNPFNGFPETDAAYHHSVAFSSELDNGELNVRHRWVSANCLVHSSFLVGVRYFRLADDLIYRTRTNLSQLNYHVKTDNDLVGVQLGGDMALCVTPRFKIAGDAKAGLYGAHSKQKTWAPSVAFSELESASDAAFVADAGLNGIFRVSPKMAIRAGYQVLFVSGVATAIENFNTNSPLTARTAFVNNNDDVVFHGANVGIEWTW